MLKFIQMIKKKIKKLKAIFSSQKSKLVEAPPLKKGAPFSY